MRQLFDNSPFGDSRDSAAYKAYLEASEYRWRPVCQACYSAMGNSLLGDTWIGGRWFSMAGVSRGDKATTMDEAKYQAWQRHEAAKFGLDLGDQA